MAKAGGSMVNTGTINRTVNRRRFMQTSIAVAGAALPVTHALSAAASMSTETGLHLERFVFDDRFAEAAEAAQQAAERGISVAAFSGDLTRLWYDDLDLRWRDKPMTLAGATTQQGLFVLETLAADRGMRVVYRAAHGAVLPRTGRAEAVQLLSWVIAPRTVTA
jgi:hypothetical protein